MVKILDAPMMMKAIVSKQIFVTADIKQILMIIVFQCLKKGLGHHQSI